MIFDECRFLLAGIGNEFGILGKEIGLISQRAAREFKDNPARYLRDSARELTQMGIRHPVLATIVGEAPSLFDEVPRPIAIPVEGSILYVDLIGEYVQHSGIYVGNRQIVELSGKGHMQRVSREQFISSGTGNDIYVSCRKKRGNRFIYRCPAHPQSTRGAQRLQHLFE